MDISRSMIVEELVRAFIVVKGEVLIDALTGERYSFK